MNEGGPSSGYHSGSEIASIATAFLKADEVKMLEELRTAFVRA